MQVRKGIKESVDKAMDEVTDKISELVTKEADKKIKGFNKTVDEATNILATYTAEKSTRKYLMYLIVLFSGMICYFAGYTYRRVNNCNPDAHFSDEQLYMYRNGVAFEELWDKLSKKSQDRLLSINKGSLPPEENSYKWVKDKNPNLDEKALRKKFEEFNGI